MGLEEILARGGDTGKPLPVVPAPKSGSDFWREFLRVEFDKMLLFALSIYLWHFGQVAYAKAAMYGLAVAINHYRFKWN